MTSHVVMVVGNPLTNDARVRKTALAVADLGYQVTVLYGDGELTQVTRGALGAVTTVGIPINYRRRERTVKRWRDAQDWRLPGLATESTGTGLRHKVQRQAWRAQEKVHGLGWRALNKARSTSLRYRWRAELGNIVDLDEAFRPVLAEQNADIIHAHDIHLLETAIRAKKESGGRIKVIYDAHEFVPGTVQLTQIEGEAVKALERTFVNDADALITVSEPIAQSLQRVYSLPRQPTVVLNSPSLTEAGTDPGTSVRQAAGLDASVPLVVYSGVINAKRGVNTVIAALHYAPGIHLAVVCVPGPDNWRAQALLKVAAKAAVTDRLHLLHPVAPDAITHYLADADIGVHPMAAGLPNHEMALPNKLFDYLFSGLPVVVTDVKLMGSFVRDHGIGLTFADGDVRDCARALTQALAEVESLRAAVRNPQLREQVCWERQVEQLAGVYERLRSS